MVMPGMVLGSQVYYLGCYQVTMVCSHQWLEACNPHNTASVAKGMYVYIDWCSKQDTLNSSTAHNFMIKVSWKPSHCEAQLYNGLVSPHYISAAYSKGETQYPQGIINHPPHGALIRPLCLGCPSHSANFKKRFNCVKMVLFGAMIFVMGRS